MKDIKCPSCGKNFRIDPSSFEEILHQIKDEEFNRQINERLQLAEEDKRKGIELVKHELKNQFLQDFQKQESRIHDLESKLNLAEEQKSSALKEMSNEAARKINFLNNKVEKLKENFEKDSLINELY